MDKAYMAYRNKIVCEVWWDTIAMFSYLNFHSYLIR